LIRCPLIPAGTVTENRVCIVALEVVDEFNACRGDLSSFAKARLRSSIGRRSRRGKKIGNLDSGEHAPYTWSHVWTCSALDRLLGDEDQAEVRPGLPGAEHSGVVERVPDGPDAGGHSQS
jgi:hypothetical protein